MNQTEAEGLVTANGGGTIQRQFIYGPASLTDLEVWEIWVTVGGNFDTRFPAEDKTSGQKIYFSSFMQLAHYTEQRYQGQIQRGQQELQAVNQQHQQQIQALNQKHQQQIQDLEKSVQQLRDEKKDLKTKVGNKQFREMVGALAFLLVLVALTAKFWFQPTLVLSFFLGSAIASGCVFFFGVWKPVALKTLLRLDKGDA